MSNRTLCPQCGWNVAVDEDGCCATCGSNATGPGVDAAATEIARLKDEINQWIEAAYDTEAKHEEERKRLREAVAARDVMGIPNLSEDPNGNCSYCGAGWDEIDEHGNCQHYDDCPTQTHPLDPEVRP